MMESNEDSRTVWCGNLSDKLTEELLYELFLQAGPLDKVRLCKDKDGKNSYGFVTFKHVVSVMYALELFSTTFLFNKRINIKPRHNSQWQNNASFNRMPNLVPPRQLMKARIENPHNNVGEIFDMALLTQMGQQMLLSHEVHISNYDTNIHTSTPVRHNFTNNRDNKPYRRHNRDVRNDRYSSNKPYRGSRNYDKWH